MFPCAVTLSSFSPVWSPMSFASVRVDVRRSCGWAVGVRSGPLGPRLSVSGPLPSHPFSAFLLYVAYLVLAPCSVHRSELL